MGFFLQFDAEFRRFASERNQYTSYDEFYKHVESIHKLENIPFTTWYTDIHGDLLPINNDDNLQVALSTAKPLLRLFVQRQGRTLLYKVICLFKLYLF